MKKISFNLLSLGCLVFVLLTLTIRKVSGFATRIESGFDFAAVDAYIAAQMDIARIPGVAVAIVQDDQILHLKGCLLYTSPSPRDRTRSRMPSSA